MAGDAKKPFQVFQKFPDSRVPGHGKYGSAIKPPAKASSNPSAAIKFQETLADARSNAGPNMGLDAGGEPARPPAWLSSLLSRRLIFVMGKGGVGKTTLSIALAGAARRQGRNPLLVELGDAESIGRLYRKLPLPPEPVPLAHGICGVRVDARAELEAYIRTHIPSKFIAGKISNSRLFDYLFEAAPGLKEIMSLGRLWRWEQEIQYLSDPPFDLIIVDAPATGHALSLLRLPEALIRMIRVGPVARQLQGLKRLLRDPERTALAIVTLAEELPVRETLAACQEAQADLEMPVGAVFINAVHMEMFSPREKDHIQALAAMYAGHPDAPENDIIRCVRRFARRQAVQQAHIREICNTAKTPVLLMPFYYTNDMTLEHLEALSSEMGHFFSVIREKET